MNPLLQLDAPDVGNSEGISSNTESLINEITKSRQRKRKVKLPK